MLQEYDRISSASSLEEKKSQNSKKSLTYDLESKILTIADLQNLLQNAYTLLQKDQIKEALKLYEHSKKPQFSS